MPTKNWPATVKVSAGDYAIDFDVQVSTMRNGRLFTYELPGARWTVSLSFPDDSEDGQRPALEAFITSLKGGANRLSLGHLGRKQPNGTMRGTPVLNGAHAQGAEQLTMASVNGTLKDGDIIGLPGQMLMVVGGSTPSGGNMVVQVAPPLFTGYANATPVTWNQPTTLWIPKSATAGPFPFRAGRHRPGFSVDFVESGV